MFGLFKVFWWFGFMPRKFRVIVQNQGRISIPKQVREALGLREGSILEVKVEENRIVLEVLVK